MSMCRQIDGCENNVSETIVGTKGQLAAAGSYRFDGPSKRTALPRSSEVNPYVQEHIDLLESIRDGKPLNELKTGRREHADGDHGPDVGLHRQGRHLGAGAELEARHLPRRAWHVRPDGRARRSPCPGVTELI